MIQPWWLEGRALLHNKHNFVVVDQILLGETIPAINMFYVLSLLENEETQLTKLLKPIWTHNPDQNPP